MANICNYCGTILHTYELHCTEPSDNELDTKNLRTLIRYNVDPIV